MSRRRSEIVSINLRPSEIAEKMSPSMGSYPAWKAVAAAPHSEALFSLISWHNIGSIASRASPHGCQLAADHAGIEAGAQERTIERGHLFSVKVSIKGSIRGSIRVSTRGAPIGGPARRARAALDHFAYDGGFVEIGEDLRDRR